MIRILLFTPETGALSEGGTELIDEWKRRPETILWADFHDEPAEREAALMHDIFAIHPLAIQDAQRTRHPPKVEWFQDYTFVLLKGLDAQSDTIDFGTIQIAVFVGAHFCVTRHSGPSPSIARLWSEIKEDPAPLRRGAGYLAVRLSRCVVDRYLPILMDLERRLDEIEEALMSSLRDELLGELIGYISNLKKLRRIMTYHVQVFELLKDQHMPGMSDGLRHEVVDVYEQLERVFSLTTLHHDVATDLRDGYISLASHRLNQIMKVLTIITAIFVPLSFMAGLYGMNFEVMPELQWPFAYYTLLGVMAAIVVSLLVIFRKRGWL
jgi:magnesium transporter